MPGFSVKILKKNPPDLKFLCESCGSLLQQARKASCGHFFCSSCVEILLCKNPGRVSYCPRSKRPLFHNETEFLPADKAFCDELHNLEVSCRGCSWTGKLQNFECHKATCEFNSCCKKQQEQFGVSEQNCCTQAEVDRNQLDNNHELLNSKAVSHAACQQNHLATCDFTSNCGKEHEQCENNERNHCNQTEVKSNQLNNDRGSLKPKSASNVLYYEEFRSFDTSGKDGNQEGMKEKLSNTALPSSLKVLPDHSALDVKEQIAPLVKDITSGNAKARNLSSYRCLKEKRLIDLEKKVEFLFEENRRLKQEVVHLKNVHSVAKRRIECIEQTLSKSLYCQNNSDNLWRAVGALKNEHATLQDRINHFLENPFSREEHVMLMRHMEAMQGQIVQIEQRVMPAIHDLSTSLTSVANMVANDRFPGVDIQPLE